MNTEYLKTLFTQRKQTRYKFCKLTGFSSGALSDIMNKKVKVAQIRVDSEIYDEFLKLAYQLREDLNIKQFKLKNGIKD